MWRTFTKRHKIDFYIFIYWLCTKLVGLLGKVGQTWFDHCWWFFSVLLFDILHVLKSSGCFLIVLVGRLNVSQTEVAPFAKFWVSFSNLFCAELKNKYENYGMLIIYIYSDAATLPIGRIVMGNPTKARFIFTLRHQFSICHISLFIFSFFSQNFEIVLPV